MVYFSIIIYRVTESQLLPARVSETVAVQETFEEKVSFFSAAEELKSILLEKKSSLPVGILISGVTSLEHEMLITLINATIIMVVKDQMLFYFFHDNNVLSE